MKKILSISVAAYNAENWLDRCIESLIIPEILESIEIIIVNDGSKDKSLDIAQKYKDKYPQSIIVINKQNGGHGSTINASKRIATGKYFKVVDSDDWVNRDGLVSLIEYLSENECDIVFSPYYVYLQNEDRFIIEDYTEGNVEKIDNQIDYEKIKLSMHSMTLSTHLAKEMADLDENCFYVDVEYITYSALKAHKIGFTGDPVYVYFIGREGQSVNTEIIFKRRDQHFKVCRSIVSYYSNIDSNNCILHNVVYNRLIALLVKHYKLLFINMNYKEGRDEVSEYDKWIKNNSIILYKALDNIPQKFLLCLKILRRTHFWGFRLVAKVFRKRIVASIENSY